MSNKLCIREIFGLINCNNFAFSQAFLLNSHFSYVRAFLSRKILMSLIPRISRVCQMSRARCSMQHSSHHLTPPCEHIWRVSLDFRRKSRSLSFGQHRNHSSEPRTRILSNINNSSLIKLKQNKSLDGVARALTAANYFSRLFLGQIKRQISCLWLRLWKCASREALAIAL